MKLDKIDFKPLEYIQKVDNYKIGICIASSGYEKQWGIEKYLQLINYLIKKGYNKFLLLSGMDQNADEKKLISHFNKNIYFETTSTNTIKEVIPKLKRCKFVIGNDTGFSHLSVAYNKKTYVILRLSSINIQIYLLQLIKINILSEIQILLILLN